MKLKPYITILYKLFTCIGLLVASHSTKAQTLLVFPTQDLSFGAIILGSSGGTVTVSNTGIRSSTGDLVLAGLGVFYFPATFEVEAPAGTIVSILSGTNFQLSGSNGGSITLNLGTSDRGSTFTTLVSPPQRTTVNIGGTLTLTAPPSNPAGNYSGTFSVTFIQQ